MKITIQEKHKRVEVGTLKIGQAFQLSSESKTFLVIAQNLTETIFIDLTNMTKGYGQKAGEMEKSVVVTPYDVELVLTPYC